LGKGTNAFSLFCINEGNAVMDIRGEEKENAKVEDLLEVFDRISIEKGN